MNTARTRLIRSREDDAGVWWPWARVFLYCAIAFPLFYVFAIMQFVLGGALVSGLFVLFGLYYVALTLRQTLDRMKYGMASVLLEGAAPVQGGELVGRVLLPRAARSARGVLIELVCIAGSPQDRASRRLQRLWYQDKSFPVQISGTRAEAQFRFHIPDAPDIERGVPCNWELKVGVEVPGLDLSRTFDISIASTPGRQPDAGLRDAAIPAVAMPVAAASTAASPRPTTLPRDPVAPAPQLGAVTRRRWPLLALGPGRTLPAAALVTANLIPLAGALWLDWRIGDIVLLYWLENVVIGMLNVLRIAFAQPDTLTPGVKPVQPLRPGELAMGKLFLGVFFIFHYGAFCAGHGIALASIFPVKGPDGGNLELGALLADKLAEPTLIVAVLALFVSHFVSFLVNYLGGGEYRGISVQTLMARPYGRILVVHLFVIFGGTAVSILNGPALAIGLFVAIKLAIDLLMHRRERGILLAPA